MENTRVENTTIEDTTFDFDKLMRLAAVTVTLVGNKDGVYIDCRNCNAYVDYEEAENFAEVNMQDVNHLVIVRLYKPYRGYVMRIVQASGYSLDRGSFIDMY